MNATDVESAARQVNDHPALVGLARLGYVASGVLHVVLGILALQVAWFGSTTSADQSGAFTTVADQPAGAFALWVVAVGFAGLALWQLTEAIGTWGGVGERAKAGGKAVLYAVLAWTAATFASGSGSSSSQQTRDFTSTLMSKPGGRLAVAVVGLAVIGVAVYHVSKGWTSKFLRDLREDPGDAVTWAGRFGYIAKGVALGVVGVLFVWAAVKARPDKAGGLDTALRTLRGEPLGAVLLTVVAVGLVAYGVYSFARARYTRT